MGLFSRIISWGMGPVSDPMIDNPYAKACSPDDLIVAHIEQSFAKDIAAWTHKVMDGYEDRNFSPGRNVYGLKLVSPEGLIVFFPVRATNYVQTELDKANGIEGLQIKASGKPAVELSDLRGHNLYKVYSSLRKVYTDALEVAAKAKAEMEANEAKWNLAEQLLGMKRNEHGALVPVVTTENTNEEG